MSKPYSLKEIAPRGSMLYNSMLGCAPNNKDKIIAIHGLHQKLFETITKCHEATVFYKKINFWQNEFENFSLSKKLHHPLIEYLYNELNSSQKTKISEFFNLWIAEVNMLFEHRRIASFEDFFIHSHHSTSLREICFHYLENNQKFFDPVSARELGVFFNLADVLLNLKHEIKDNLFRIPREILEKNHVKEEIFLNNPLADSAITVCHTVYQSALEYFEKAKKFYEKTLHAQPTSSIEVLRSRWILAQLYLAQLQKLYNKNFNYNKTIKIPFYKQIGIVVKNLSLN